jgi:hypothetical protein
MDLSRAVNLEDSDQLIDIENKIIKNMKKLERY